MAEDVSVELKKLIEQKVLRTSPTENIVSTNGEKALWLFDFRRVLFSPEALLLTADALWKRLEPHYPFQIGGLETASIPLIVSLVLKSKESGKPINGFFIRKSRKPEGLQRIIEGEISDDKIILVDDILNSGRTFNKQIEILKNIGRNVERIQTILRFREASYYQDFAKQGIVIDSLFSLEDFGKKYPSADQKVFTANFFSVNWYVQCAQANYFYVGPKSAPLADEENLYMGSDDGTFFALRQKDGSVLWSKKILFGSKGKYIFSSPAILGDIVYYGGYDGTVYARDKHTGATKWTFMEADWVGSSPAVAPDLNLVFVGLEFGLIKKRGGIVALDARTGDKKWEYVMPEYTHGSPAYSQRYGVVGIGSNDGIFYLFSAATGALLWKLQTGGEIKYSCTFDEERGYVMFGSFDSKLYIVSIASGQIVNTFATKAGIYATPLVFDGNVYIASLDKRLYSINLDTFNLNWEFLTSGRIFASPEVIKNKIYIGSNDGRLYEVGLDGKENGFFQATERITNKISYNPDSGQIFLPTYANEIYCLERNPE